MVTTPADPVPVPAGVGRTALGAAMVRAVESRRADRLFHDPYAAAFLAAAPAVFGREQRGTAALVGGVSSAGVAFWTRAVLRTRFFDDHLLRCAAGGLTQLVILAAGLDTRAYRLPWPPGTTVFELDLPDVLAFKRHVLAGRRAQPRCAHRQVPADLHDDFAGPLRAAGLRPDLPTGWLLEGLLIYLSADETVHVLGTVDALSAAGSRAAFEAEPGDTAAATLRAQAERLPGLQPYAAMWKGGLPDAPGWLADRGWLPQRHDGADLAARHGRAVPSSPGGFVTATKSPPAA
ncbi:SAM-dependent methyltransferase [Dactylosporangium sp. NPDC050688]|uniref:SAM-dependent methyltransferase n=1 Tax=Dactylosporangium sp. NPDC050688 TaxID=3157217 RepID=UPI0033F61B14